MTNQDSSDEFPATAVMVEEALRNFVPFELWQAYEQAAKGRREFPRRIVRYSEYLHGPQAIAANRAAAQAKTAEAAMKQAWQQIMGELRSQLLAGKLTAYVRDVFPFGPVRPIPPDAWRSLRITDRSGRAKGPGVELTGIRIAPGPPQQCHLTRDIAADLPQSTGNRQPHETMFTANKDYTFVCIGTAQFRFVGLQAAVVRQLHEASLTDNPWRHGKVLLHQASAATRSIGDLFRRHRNPSWRLLIDDRRGMYRLRVQAPTGSDNLDGFSSVSASSDLRPICVRGH